MNGAKSYDVAEVGAGVFGSWTAWHLVRAGKKVALLDAYGPANARASSAGESRIIRAGYGPDALYTRWARHSLKLWQEFFTEIGTDLFHRTGLLWLTREQDVYAKQTAGMLSRNGVPFERLERPEMARRFPQFNFDGVDWAIFEPESGALMARRALQAVVVASVRTGVTYLQAGVKPPAAKGNLENIETQAGERISAGAFVFACGPWLEKVFPSLLGERIFPSRQEVFFFGVPAGGTRFAPPAMPAWIYLGDEVYGLPDFESR